MQNKEKVVQCEETVHSIKGGVTSAVGKQDVWCE